MSKIKNVLVYLIIFIIIFILAFIVINYQKDEDSTSPVVIDVVNNEVLASKVISISGVNFRFELIAKVTTEETYYIIETSTDDVIDTTKIYFNDIKENAINILNNNITITLLKKESNYKYFVIEYPPLKQEYNTQFKIYNLHKNKITLLEDLSYLSASTFKDGDIILEPLTIEDNKIIFYDDGCALNIKPYIKKNLDKVSLSISKGKITYKKLSSSTITKEGPSCDNFTN